MGGSPFSPPTFGFQESNMPADLKASIFAHLAISLAQEHLSDFKNWPYTISQESKLFEDTVWKKNSINLLSH